MATIILADTPYDIRTSSQLADFCKNHSSEIAEIARQVLAPDIFQALVTKYFDVQYLVKALPEHTAQIAEMVLIPEKFHPLAISSMAVECIAETLLEHTARIAALAGADLEQFQQKVAQRIFFFVGSPTDLIKCQRVASLFPPSAFTDIKSSYPQLETIAQKLSDGQPVDPADWETTAVEINRKKEQVSKEVPSTPQQERYSASYLGRGVRGFFARREPISNSWMSGPSSSSQSYQ